ncbi:acyl-CoA thioesterase [Deinococcus metallilatus]|uniref:Acyl-CoA thioester hydrolase n=2 Tax=Deinococcus metallilatus TaxID=1211322 RepID=A0AAJ5F9S0_9DEIO|nr:thioesterase family protein [Deinococcus metallilatus]MBB5294796.1 acyl-CoA thioester hydrolase [Deinococcus metallilatus]QBY09483.1 acyl-CoA thioesterase [Deinococcus metallilatus]RXJ09488.1 acyl-CoA thioesterase [Deinococcus metallilatus]TLK29010.1 acyl-CoA thioesterase [Deinococcus metallilatus]GMA16722.1 4-hydroxybenzoyl-CoA thioesterase [Deinococcus metallilatus]
MTVPLESRSDLRVRYAETDAMGVAHHANYPVWFEVGRGDLMHRLGLPYAEVEARGYYLMLSGLNVEYRRAARYDDHLTLITRVGSVRSRTLTFSYELWRGEELLATGETRHIATDKSYRPARLPEDVLTLLAGGAAGG